MSVRIIAEAGVNHNGSIDRAIELIDAAANAGADDVKFQTYQVDQLVTSTAPKAAYQKQTTGADESQHEMLKKLQLSYDAHYLIRDHCQSRKIKFLSAPFDSDSVTFLTSKMNLKTLKIPSGEITNGPLLVQIARCGVDVILSTGMCTLTDVEQALAVLAFGYTSTATGFNDPQFGEGYRSQEGQKILKEKVTLLHCTTEYPTLPEDVNLNAMQTLHTKFGLDIGLSDHTEGIYAPIAAVAMGAQIIEKHFTLDRTLPGPDHAASLEPNELTEMVEAIRNTSIALGNSDKKPAPGEVKNMEIARKSLVALKNIKAGEKFCSDNIGARRPGTGISPMKFWELLETEATRDYNAGELLSK